MATSQYYAVHMAPKVAYATQQDNTDLKNAQVPIQAGTIVIDSSQTPFQVLGIADGSGNFGPVGISLGNYSWATRPSAASVPVGTIITITDIAAQSHQRFSDGTYWRPMASVPLLSQLTTITKTDADTNTQQVISFTIPGNFAPPGTAIKFEGTFKTDVIVNVQKTFEFIIGGVGAGTFLMAGGDWSTRIAQTMIMDSNKFTTWWPGFSVVFGPSAASSNSQTSLDLTVSRTLTLTMKWETAGAGTHTLTAYPCKLWLEP